MFNYDQSYPGVRQPVFARNVVATSHPLAAQAGLRVLRQGGNAVDAAVAAAAALTVCEPVSNGLGSDAFCILWDGKQLHGLNAAGRAPQGWTRSYFQKKYPDAPEMPQRGIDSVTVPGAVSAWVQLNKRFGALSLADTLQPAIEMAEQGFAVPVVVQRKWAAGAAQLAQQPGFAQVFMPRGRVPEVGEIFRFPALAHGLKRIANSRGVAFYGGEIAHAIEHLATEQGGVLRASDFESYQPEWVQPLAMNYRGYTLHEIGPSTHGIAALIALGILSHFDLARLGADSVSAQHVQIEAIKLAMADVYHYVGEEPLMAVQPAQLLDMAYLKSRARKIRLNRAQAHAVGEPPKGGTVYVAAADASGMMVSFIQSNYMGFGSGCVETEYGVSLKNRGHCFRLAEGANQVGPGKRPFHTIIPAFLTKDGQPQMAFGVMGARMQPQAHVQALVRMLDYRQNPQAACDAPRWYCGQGLDVSLEESMNPKLVQELHDKGHNIVPLPEHQDFGAGQFVWRLPPGEGETDACYIAATDSRRDGTVACW